MHNKKRIAIGIPLLVIFSYFVLNAVAQSYLKNLIINQVELKSKGNYKLTIEEFHLSLIRRSLEAKEFSFQQKDIQSSSFSSKEIRISQINLTDLFINDKINIGSIILEKSKIIVKADTSKAEDNSENVTDSTQYFFYDLLKDKFKSLAVKEIEINNPHIMFYRNRSDSSLFISSENGKIRMINLLIDSNTACVQKRSFSADTLNINLKNIKNIIGDSLYTLVIPTFTLTYTQSKIDIDSLQLIPNYSKKEFSKVYGSQNDRFTLFIKSVSIDSIDVKRLIEKFECNAKSVNFDSVHVSIYRNKYIHDIIEKKKFIQELISGIQIPIRLNRLNVKDSYLEYEELVPPASEPGKVAFSELNASFNYISNYISDTNKVMTVIAKGKLNNASPIETQMRFPMNKKYFSGTGSIHNIPMTEMNSMMESTSGATITDGYIDSVSFTFLSDNYFSRGRMQMIYHDFRVAAKNISENDTMKATLRIKSFIANNFILKKSNPEKGEKIRVVKLSHRYMEDRFLISNLWKTLLGGIQRTIGVEPQD